MDFRSTVTSLGKSIQSMRTKEICILVVNDDFTCRNIVAEMLQHCSYEVLHIGKAMDALNAIRGRNGRLQLVLTNVHRLDANGLEIVQHIQKEFNLPTLLMSPDDTKIVSRGKASIVAAYVVKSLSMIDIKNLWQYALAREQGKKVADEQLVSVQMESSILENVVEASAGNNTSSAGEGNLANRKCKRKGLKETNVTNEVGRDDSPEEKKPRVVWTCEMHHKFLEAIEKLGYDRAFPKKIVEVMNVPGLTRENVASHLQKYRMCLKRAQEGFAGSLYKLSLANDVKDPCSFPSGNSALNFNLTQENSLHPKQMPSWSTFAQSLHGINSIPASNHSSFINTKASTGMPKLGQEQLVTAHTQGNLQYPTSRNASPFGELPQKYNNHMNFGNSQHTDQSSLAQVELRYPSNVQVNQKNFRVYGDQTKNMLLSIESGSSSRNANNSSNFTGLRLAGNGQSLEFGLTGVSIADGIIGEILSPVEGSSGNDWQLPSLPPGGIYGRESSDLNHSTNINSIHEQQLSLPLLETSGDNTSVQTPLLYVNYNSQQPPSSPPLGKYDHVNSIQYPSISAENLFQQPTYLPPLGTLGNECLVQHPSTSDSCIPLQQSSLSPLDTFGIESTGQYILTCDGYILDEQCHLPPLPPLVHDLDSFGAEVNSILLPATGSTSPQMFWDNEIDETLFNQAD